MQIIAWVIANAKDIVEFIALFGLIGAGFKFAKSLEAKLNSLPVVQNDIDEIKKQLKTNGGGSLKDAIIRIERTTETTNRDVSILKGREEARMYLDSEPMFECDTDGYASFLNKALLDILGMNIGECIGYGWLKAVKQNEQDRVLKEWKLAIRSGKEFSSFYTFINQRTKVETKVHGKARIERMGNEILFVIGVCEPLNFAA